MEPVTNVGISPSVMARFIYTLQDTPQKKAVADTTRIEVKKKVFICSPFRAVSKDKLLRKAEQSTNMTIAKAACRLATTVGYEPRAPHLYFPQFLDDETPEEREMGIILGLMWLKECDEVWVVGNRVSEGMGREIAEARRQGKPIRAIAVGNEIELFIHEMECGER